jgi:transcriptional regulator with XRE-family HTH domain
MKDGHTMTTRQFQSFAEQLRHYRREQGLTQEALAEAAGLSARGIRALEKGERTTPHSDTVQLLADALQLSPGERVRFEPVGRRLLVWEAPAQPAPAWVSYLGARPNALPVAHEDEVSRALRLLDGVEQGEGRLILLAREAGVILGGDGVSALLDRYWLRRAAS